jgi:putative ABC transport system substrate-binding protein
MRLPKTVEAWTEGLRVHGYVEGQNLRVAYRNWQAQTEQIPALVTELLEFAPEDMVAATPQSAVAVHATAPIMPLVFLNVGDPVALGLVQSLANPGGNVTGFATLAPAGFVGKQLQILHEFVPRASRIAVLINPMTPTAQIERQKLPQIGRALGLDLIVEASGPDQLEPAFERARKEGAEAIHVWGDSLVLTHSAEVVGLAASHHLPAIYLERR